MSGSKIPEAAALSEALHRWCKENRYFPANQLQKELGIEDRAWQTIYQGQSIALDVEAYAKLYARTSLEEADPTKLPPRVFITPQRGEVLRPRAWTDQQWQKWKLANPQYFHSKPSQLGGSPPREKHRATEKKQEVGTSDTSSSIGQMVGQFIDQFVEGLARQLKEQRPVPDGTGQSSSINTDLLAEQVASKVSQRLAQQAAPQAETNDVSALANKLIEALMPYKTGSSSDRDRLITRHKDALSELWKILSILTLPRAQREAQINRPTIQFLINSTEE